MKWEDLLGHWWPVPFKARRIEKGEANHWEAIICVASKVKSSHFPRCCPKTHFRIWISESELESCKSRMPPIVPCSYISITSHYIVIMNYYCYYYHIWFIGWWYLPQAKTLRGTSQPYLNLHKRTSDPETAPKIKDSKIKADRGQNLKQWPALWQ